MEFRSQIFDDGRWLYGEESQAFEEERRNRTEAGGIVLDRR